MVPGLGHDQWEIKMTSLKKEKDLGSGQFGQVYLATWRQEAPSPAPSLFGGCVGKSPSLAPVKVAVKEMQSGILQSGGYMTEMSKSIVKGIGIGVLSCIGIGIAKTTSQVLVLLRQQPKYWY